MGIINSKWEIINFQFGMNNRTIVSCIQGGKKMLGGPFSQTQPMSEIGAKMNFIICEKLDECKTMSGYCLKDKFLEVQEISREVSCNNDS